jgi:Trk-type K+ transport system membrane component
MVNGGASSLLIRYFTTGSIVLGSGIFKIVLINHWKKKWFFSYLVDKRKFSKNEICSFRFYFASVNIWVLVKNLILAACFFTLSSLNERIVGRVSD